ncbi:hypothetical protein Hdeb2414_s0801g00948521 [Helianthus debilis subsp. tardiflorus]
MRVADNTRGIEMNRMKESNYILQKLAEGLKERHDYMKQWYDSRNTTIVDGVKKINDGFEFLRKHVNILWGDRCKQQELLKKKDDDPEDQGNPDPSATSEQPPAATSSQIVVFKPVQLGFGQGTVEEVLLSLNAMKEIDDAEIDRMPSEPESVDVENIEEIMFEENEKKSTYVRADRTEFDPFDEEWMQENQEDIDEQLKNRTSSDNLADAFQEWRRRFLSRVERPTPPEVQVDFLQFKKVKPHGRILCWMFVKEIHCIALMREFGIKYFRSLLSILSLPFYDVAGLTQLELINRSNF